MATITNGQMIRDFLLNDGRYPGDPQLLAIYEFNNQEGARFWMVAYVKLDIENLVHSPAVYNIHLLWSRERGLTPDGQRFLDGYGKAA